MARNPLYATGLPLLLEALPNCRDSVFETANNTDHCGPLPIGDPAGHTITLTRNPYTDAYDMLRYSIMLYDANEALVQTLTLWVSAPSTTEAAINRQAVIDGIVELAGNSVLTVTKRARAR